MAMTLFSPRIPAFPVISAKPHCSQRNYLSLFPKKNRIGSQSRASALVSVASDVEIETGKQGSSVDMAKNLEEKLSNGVAAVDTVSKFLDTRWVGGTWDLTQFKKDGQTDWDAVIDAEVKRRKWLEMNPESSSSEDPVIFDTSIIPWWSWIKRFHLPEAELLNGRAAMVGFFMAYFVDSLTGVGLVDQMGNFFCKFFLLVSVLGVLFVRKNEDIDNLKKLLEESTFYDKQWQATWQEENPQE